MKRRNAIKMLGIGMGYSLSAASLTTMISSCKPDPKITWTPCFFTPHEARLVEDLLEVMLPKTDTPGAKEVGLANFIDLVVHDVYTVEDQEKFRKGMTAFFGKLGDETAQKKAGPKELTTLLESHLNKIPKEEEERVKVVMGPGNLPETEADQDIFNRYSFINNLRSLAISGYFSSQLVGTEYLNYAPVPGPYQGCIPFSDVGTSWAL